MLSIIPNKNVRRWIGCSESRSRQVGGCACVGRCVCAVPCPLSVVASSDDFRLKCTAGMGRFPGLFFVARSFRGRRQAAAFFYEF
jgi:hypothetical protein